MGTDSSGISFHASLLVFFGSFPDVIRRATAEAEEVLARAARAAQAKSTKSGSARAFVNDDDDDDDDDDDEDHLYGSHGAHKGSTSPATAKKSSQPKAPPSEAPPGFPQVSTLRLRWCFSRPSKPFIVVYE